MKGSHVNASKADSLSVSKTKLTSGIYRKYDKARNCVGHYQRRALNVVSQ